MGPLNIIDRHLVKTIRWDLEPNTYDQRLHQLNNNYDEFIIVNPIYDNWILDYLDLSPQSDSCLMWVKGDKWIAKKFTKNWSPRKGWKVIECDFKVAKIDNIEIIEEFNPDLPTWLFPEINYVIEPEDYHLVHTWFLDRKYFPNDRVWVKKLRINQDAKDIKDMGYVTPMILDELDVIFISYDESNAEHNWKKVLDKVPYAQRVHGIKGIFEAHKAAAEIAQTDMFWVVDGDAEILDDWHFNYQPGIFNRDCVHVWRSRNPINDLEYGYGGVKLFPRQLILETQSWNVDMTTGLGKLKVMNKVSNITAFNTDPLSTWRSAFRECAKLAAGTIKNQIEDENQQRLDIWLTKGKDRPFGNYALHGARAGFDFGNENKLNTQLMKCINDRQWLENKFNEQIF